MIVNYTNKGWEVITQRAHGLLASKLAMHWKFRNTPTYWLETIMAIAEHDDAENELDGENLLTATGGPLNYSMKDFEREHCEKLLELSVTKSLYIALLTSLHMDFLYKKESKNNTEVKKFLSDQDTLRAKWRKELKITKPEVENIYRLMEWCDACSLLICQRSMQPEKREIQISQGPDKQMHQLIQITDEILSIKPWPYSTDEFTIHYESRLITQLQFKNSAEFRKVFLDAPVELNSYLIQRG